MRRIPRLYLRHQVARFVLFFAGRSGSTYLISLLNSHPAVLALGERLADVMEDGTGAQLGWTEEFLRPPALGRNRAMGFKTKLVDVLDPGGLASLLRRMNIQVIRLDRRNHVKAVVSHINALRLWEQTGRWNLYDKQNPQPSLPLDVKATTRKNTKEDLRSVILNFEELRSHYVGTFYELMFDEILVP